MGPPQGGPCDVGSRPVPGGDPGFLERKPGRKESRGRAPAPPFLGPARSHSLVLAWWGAARRCCVYFAAHVRALIWGAFFVLFLNSMRVSPSPSTNPPLPARPAGGRAVTGVGYRAAGQAKKEGGPPQGPPKLEKVGPGRKNLFLPGVLSSGFLPKKAGPPPGAGRATGRCAPRAASEPPTRRVRSPAPAGQGPHQTGALFFCAILCNFFAPTVYAGVQLWPRFPRG